MLTHVNIKGSKAGTQRTHHPPAVSQDSGKEVLQLAILGSEPSFLQTVLCVVSTTQAISRLTVFLVFYCL